MEMMRASESASCTVSEVLLRLRANAERGLDSGEVDQRRKVHGYNEFVIHEDEPLWRKYVNQVL